jgi:hypothetical protein
MNNKGFLLAEETLKIIIAVISITFLIYFLTSLYLSNQNSKNLEFAEASLNYLVDEINSNVKEVEIYNPEGWVVVSWPHKATTGFFLKQTKNGLPNFCGNLGWKKCICICEKDFQDECDEMGVCLESAFEVEGHSIKINPIPMKLNIDSTNKIIK